MEKNGTNGFITAGHCFNTSQYVWQPEVQAFSTTNRTAKPTAWSGETTTADAAFIPYDDVDALIWENDPVKGELTSVSNIDVGNYIAYEGIINNLQSGPITCVSCTTWTDTSYFDNQIQANMKISGGDSGGPAFVTPNWTTINAAGLATTVPLARPVYPLSGTLNHS